MVAMASASAEMSAHAHLHLDPTLEVAPEIPIKARCNTCCPIGAIFKKIFCCCSSNCCNKTEVHNDRIVYCKSDGTCVPFDPSKSSNHKEDMKKTATRVKALVEVEKSKKGNIIRQETGIDLEGKSLRGEPLRLGEVRRIQSLQ